MIEGVMVRFYDSKNETDQSRVEALLRSRGIEYSVSLKSGGGEILVAEEDLPFAEELLCS